MEKGVVWPLENAAHTGGNREHANDMDDIAETVDGPSVKDTYQGGGSNLVSVDTSVSDSSSSSSRRSGGGSTSSGSTDCGDNDSSSTRYPLSKNTFFDFSAVLQGMISKRSANHRVRRIRTRYR